MMLKVEEYYNLRNIKNFQISNNQILMQISLIINKLISNKELIVLLKDLLLLTNLYKFRFKNILN